MHAQHLDDSQVITLRIYLQLHSAKQWRALGFASQTWTCRVTHALQPWVARCNWCRSAPKGSDPGNSSAALQARRTLPLWSTSKKFKNKKWGVMHKRFESEWRYTPRLEANVIRQFLNQRGSRAASKNKYIAKFHLPELSGLNKLDVPGSPALE
jgi:hypothetical protein